MINIYEFLWELFNKEPNVDKENTYCEDCGKKLIYEKRGIRFSKKTGEPVVIAHILRCPDSYYGYGDDNTHAYYSWAVRVKENKNG